MKGTRKIGSCWAGAYLTDFNHHSFLVSSFVIQGKRLSFDP